MELFSGIIQLFYEVAPENVAQAALTAALLMLALGYVLSLSISTGRRFGLISDGQAGKWNAGLSFAMAGLMVILGAGGLDHVEPEAAFRAIGASGFVQMVINKLVYEVRKRLEA